MCLVNVARQYLSNLPQGGLEVLCILTFQAFNEKVGKKAKKLMESALSVKMKASVLEGSTLSECKAVARNIWRILLQWMITVC